MMKKKVVISNIQENHTLSEYQRYFSHLLKKGKIKRYSLNEKNKLNPNKQYWKIKDEKGKTYYYELPKYIKPSYTKSAYSLKRVAHRRPARAALAIFIGTAILSFTSAIVTKKIFVKPIEPPTPVDFASMQEKLKYFHEWYEDNPAGDVTKDEQFKISDLAIIGMANALYDVNNPINPTNEEGEDIYNRRPLLCVGHGETVTNAFIMKVDVAISNAFIYQEGKALEESISHSDKILAPKVGRRDFYNIDNDGHVNSNRGDATSSTSITWEGNFDRKYGSADAYTEKAGKYPDNPFLYTIDEDTVLGDSSAFKTSEGYQINLNLDTTKSISRYVKRILYLSDKTVTSFSKVNLTFFTDSELRPLTMGVDEKYVVEGALDTTGKLTTKFYYDDVPDIPSITEAFDYSKYPF